MSTLRNSSFLRTAILLCGLFVAPGVAWANAGVCTPEAGGIGGTGAPSLGSGIGGTGTTANDGGIGGTGATAMGGGIGGTGQMAGKVLFAVGRIEVQSPGRTRMIAKGDPVCAGETLQTGKNALVQLSMADGGTVLLRPNSRLTIETFVYHGVEDGSERSELALLEGGMRTVTGAIGKRHKEAYGIRTPNAEISIRGTDHETFFVPAPQAGQLAPVEPGTYNRVISGATVLQTEKGKLLIGPNQTGFAALHGAAPVMLEMPPPLFGDPITKPDKHNKQAVPETRSDRETLENSGAGNPETAAEGDGLVTPIKLGDGEIELHEGLKATSPAESSSFMVGAQTGSRIREVGSVRASDSGSHLLLNAQELPASVSNNATHFNYLANGASLVNSGDEDLAEADINWGIYAGGVSFDSNGNAIPVDFHHFVYAKSGATPPEVISTMTGSASFSNLFGFTPPTDELGGIGGSVNLNVNVSLGANAAVTSYNVGVIDAHARNWNGTFNGNVPLGTFAQTGVPLAVSCTGASCGSGVGSGTAVGILVGPSANGLISAYGLSTTTGQNVVGTAVLSR